MNDVAKFMLINRLLEDDDSLRVLAKNEDLDIAYKLDYNDWAMRNLYRTREYGEIDGLAALANLNLDELGAMERRKSKDDHVVKIRASLSIKPPEGEVAAELFALGIIRRVGAGVHEISYYEPGFFFDDAKKYPGNPVLAWFHNLYIWMWNQDDPRANSFRFPSGFIECENLFHLQCEHLARISTVILEKNGLYSLSVKWGELDLSFVTVRS